MSVYTILTGNHTTCNHNLLSTGTENFCKQKLIINFLKKFSLFPSNTMKITQHIHSKDDNFELNEMEE